jgi:hypothetical protein
MLATIAAALLGIFDANADTFDIFIAIGAVLLAVALVMVIMDKPKHTIPLYAGLTSFCFAFLFLT